MWATFRHLASGIDVLVCCVHLPASNVTDEAGRRRNAAVIAKRIGNPRRAIIAGDFNSSRAPAWFPTFTDPRTSAVRRTGGQLRTSDPDGPGRAIDHVLVRGLTPLTYEVRDGRPSDHQSVAVGFTSRP